MIKQYLFLLEGIDEAPPLSFHSGSLLHGALLEQMPPEVANALHQTALRPYSQYLYLEQKSGQSFWVLNTLTAEIDAIIATILTEWSTNALFLQGKKASYRLHKKGEVTFSYAELTEKFLLSSEPMRYANVQIISPTAFKSAGDYLFFPTPEHFLYSVWQKWNCFSDADIFDDKALFKLLSTNLKLIDYRLHSLRYPLEKTRIPAFCGSLSWQLRGSDICKRLNSLLFCYSHFTGIGIKTALGMGGQATLL